MTSATDTETQGWVPAIGFGDRLRVIRRKKHRSQTEMAELLAVKKVTYASWEAGTATPSYEDVVAIARRIQLLDRVPVAWTLGAYEEAPRPDGPDGGLSVRHQGLEPRTRWFTDNIVSLPVDGGFPNLTVRNRRVA